MKKMIFVAAALLCYAIAWADQTGGERIETFASNVVWREDAGVFVEMSGKIIKAAQDEGSVVFRGFGMLPLTLVFDSVDSSWQLVGQGGLGHDIATATGPSGAQTVAFRLRVRSLQRPVQRVVLEELRNGTWCVVISQDAALKGLREWIEHHAIVTAGIAGSITLADVNVRVIRENTLFLVK